MGHSIHFVPVQLMPTLQIYMQRNTVQHIATEDIAHNTNAGMLTKRGSIQTALATSRQTPNMM